jgi:hypothetical protein
MYEAMNYITEGQRTFSFKIRKGFFKTKEEAVVFAKKRAEGIPFVLLQGRCVWSPLSDKLGV